MFGDILSDAAAMMTGSLGMLPSASIGRNKRALHGMYEPVHGSAPDISGLDKANPLAMILSVGMMMRYSFDLTEADEMIQRAVVKTLETYRTNDIMAEGKTLIGCQEMGERVLQILEQK